MPICVVDSGVGGLSILKALRAELPHEDFIYLADTAYAPYGERGDAYVIDRTQTIVQQLRDEHAIKALIIACNTATAAAIHLLRSEHPDLPIVGVEPALKPAVTLSRTRRIGVMATRGTLESVKFQALHDSLKGQAEFVLQACDGLADAIEHDDAAQMRSLCSRYTVAFRPIGNGTGAIDTLVLGCTHYAFARAALQPLLGTEVRLIETGVPVARHTRNLLARADLLGKNGFGGLTLRATKALPMLHAAAARWL